MLVAEKRHKETETWIITKLKESYEKEVWETLHLYPSFRNANRLQNENKNTNSYTFKRIMKGKKKVWVPSWKQ